MITSLSLVAAMHYAARGWRVFPLSANSKKPLPGTQGFLDATSSFSTLARVFTEHPNANIGLATGAGSGVWCLDVDPKHGGMDSLWRLMDGIQDETMMDTYTVKTMSGGLHLYYEWNHDADPLPRKIDLFKRQGLPGLDLIGNDGYVVLPPSKVGEGVYTVDNDGFVMRASDLLMGAIRGALNVPDGIRGPRVTGEVREPVRGGTLGILGWLVQVQPGGQDDAIQWVARALKDEGMTRGEAGGLLLEAVGQMATDGRPWTENDIRRHINSAYR